MSIPDPGTVRSKLTVPASQAAAIFDLNVKLTITHKWDSDLDVFLIAPDGTRVELFTDVGGSGDNFTNTVLDDEAATPITAGAAPFSATYRPEGFLSALDGKNVAGDWYLEVTDDTWTVRGTLRSWSITVTVPTTGGMGLSLAEGLVESGKASTSIRHSPSVPAVVLPPEGPLGLAGLLRERAGSRRPRIQPIGLA